MAKPKKPEKKVPVSKNTVHGKQAVKPVQAKVIKPFDDDDDDFDEPFDDLDYSNLEFGDDDDF